MTTSPSTTSGTEAGKPEGSIPRVASTSRQPALDALRALACAMVVVCHVSLYQGDGSLLGLKNGVMLFFSLSGYLLYRPFIGSVDLRRYAIHRAARILPAYLVALAGLSLVTGSDLALRDPLSYALLLQNYDPARWQGFLGVSWTLTIEVAFYITLPILARVIGRSLPRLAVLAGLSFLGALEVLALGSVESIRFTSSLYPFIAWAFAPGIAVAILEDRLGHRARSPLLPVMGVTLIAFGTTAYWSSVDLASGLGAGLLVAWAVARQPSLGRLAGVASAGAAISYSAYLWHVDLIQRLPSPVLAVGATIAVSGCVYLLAERPALRLARSYRRRPPRDPQSDGLVALAPLAP